MDAEFDDGVSWTLLATLYLRAWENGRQRPILGDRYATEAIERIDYDWPRLKRRVRPSANQYLVTLRARRLDDWARDFLDSHPDATVIHLACGLDSRMLRLDPDGSRDWYDLDMPHVIDLRRRLYPERGRYHLIGASVTDDGWLDQIPADRPALIVAEGLVPYLTEDETRRLFRRLTDHFPAGELLFDTIAPLVARRSKLFKWGPRDGREIEQWDDRLTCAARVPFTAAHALIPARGYRTLYRLINAVPPLRETSVYYRFTF